MLTTGVSSTATDDVSGKVRQGVRRAMMDAADAGFAVSFDEAPEGATGGLKMSAVEPTWAGDQLVWGYNADYARSVEEGAPPRMVPFDAIQQWARRVLGDEAAAGAVWRKIAREGTEAQPYVEPGFVAMVREIDRRGLSDSIEHEL